MINNINCIILGNNSKAFFFEGSQYYRCNLAGFEIDQNYPKPIKGHWQGLWDEDIDAGVNWGNNKVYFFKGNEYIRYDFTTHKADPGYPKPIAGNWPGVWEIDIDSAVNWGNGKAYFFKGSEYIRYDLKADKTDTGYPKPISGNWPGLWDSGIGAAVNWGNGKAYFFKGEEFISYDIASDRTDSGYPQRFSGGLSPAKKGELSARRKYIIDVLLPGVLPSSYGEQKFTKLTFGLTKDNPNVTPGYTTCGSLPMYIARMLKDKLIGGTNGVRTSGQKKNAWVVADRVKRPLPGDIYALLNKDETDVINSGISHVGIIIDSSGTQWKTADAGQGDGWAADYVTREYDEENGTLTGEVVRASGARPPRVLAGWIDVDTYPFP